MERSFWLERWQTGQIGFHASEVNPHLRDHLGAITGAASSRILVPLCGKTLDLGYIAQHGHQVVGIELIELAAQQFFTENDIAFEVDSSGAHPVYSGGGVEIHCADFFDIEATELGAIDGVWDRAAMVALPPEPRARYCERLKTLVSGPILLNTFTYDTRVMDGPPFSIEEAEVRQAYADRTIEILSHVDVIDRVAFKDRGHTTWLSTLWLISCP